MIWRTAAQSAPTTRRTPPRKCSSKRSTSTIADITVSTAPTSQNAPPPRASSDERHPTIEAAVEEWERDAAKPLLRRIAEAVIPREVQFRRELAQSRRTGEAMVERRRRAMHIVPERNRDD